MTNTLSTYLDSIFDDFAGLRPMTTRLLSTSPALNIREFDDRYEVYLTIPGLDASKMSIQVVDTVLNISYTHKEENEEESNGKLIRQEYSHYSFSRSITLPQNIDNQSIEAKSAKGVLTVIIKKLPEKQPRKIDISISE